MVSRKWSNPKRIAFSIWCGIGLIAGVTAMLYLGTFTNVCSLPGLLDPKQPVDGWCFEFYLNRYQTLIGGIVAVAAAAVAWRAATKQLMFGRVQELRLYLHDLRELRALHNQIVKKTLVRVNTDALAAILSSRVGTQPRLDILVAGREDLEEILRLRRKIRRTYRRMYIDSQLMAPLAALRTQVSDACDEAKIMYNNALRVMNDAKGMPIILNRLNEQLELSRSRCMPFIETVAVAKEKAVEALEKEIATVEEQIHELNAGVQIFPR